MAYNQSVEAHLDRVFRDGARQLERSMRGKTYTYKICGMGYTAENGERGSGRCSIESVRYNRELDCNVMTFKDLDTGEVRSICQFEVNIKDEE